MKSREPCDELVKIKMGPTLAILGANSQIARDLVVRLVKQGYRLLLYSRDKLATEAWVVDQGIGTYASACSYDSYDSIPHEAVLNFVGVGDPRRALEIGADIFDITKKYDDLAISGLQRNPSRRYIFFSSGAVYGDVFDQPIDNDQSAKVAINSTGLRDWYSLAKLAAELRHRACHRMDIVDVRIFNYFSRSQNIESKFFISQLVKGILKKITVEVSNEFMVRDYIHPSDLFKLIQCILSGPASNVAVDCYSAEPVDNFTLLQSLRENFGLLYQVTLNDDDISYNATGRKPYYYSSNRTAEIFGYVPEYTSLAGLLAEISAVLKKSNAIQGNFK